MFKNFLTYQFAQGFHRDCFALELPSAVPATVKERLVRSADQFWNAYLRSHHSSDPKDEARFLFSAIVNLRDCREILTEAQGWNAVIESRFFVLQGRLEDLLKKSADGEGGQFRMLG